MKDELFDELIESIREGGQILRGERAAARATRIDRVDAKEVRGRLEMTQDEFAAFLGVSVATLRNWEQGRREPQGPARVLLMVAARRPDAIWDVVRAHRIEAESRWRAPEGRKVIPFVNVKPSAAKGPGAGVWAEASRRSAYSRPMVGESYGTASGSA